MGAQAQAKSMIMLSIDHTVQFGRFNLLNYKPNRNDGLNFFSKSSGLAASDQTGQIGSQKNGLIGLCLLWVLY